MTQSVLKHELVKRIKLHGKITFAEFMDVVLYHPIGGYYSAGDRFAIGSKDYYTSVNTHPGFGAVIAVQLFGMWEALGQPKRFDVVESGASTGLLAKDVLGYSKYLPDKFRYALEYTVVDIWSGQFSNDHSVLGYNRVVSSGLPFSGIIGCVISNELFDSFPVHLTKIINGEVKEIYVTYHDGVFKEIYGMPSSSSIESRARALGINEGQLGEINTNITHWITELGHLLDTGFVLTVDYGYHTSCPRNPMHANSTLQTYYKHTRGSNPYEHIGLQDITTHVDFSVLINEGMLFGLEKVMLCTQAQYMYGFGLYNWLQMLRTHPMTQRERDSNMIALRELAKENGLGDFKVLIQEKRTGITELADLIPKALNLKKLPLPLLRNDHISILDSRYPHSTMVGYDLCNFDTNM